MIKEQLVNISLPAPLDPEETVLLFPDMDQAGRNLAVTDYPVHKLKTGQVLLHEGRPALKLEEKVWANSGNGSLVLPAWKLRGLDRLPSEILKFEILESGPALAWITMSDKGSKGKRKDESGPLIEEMVGRKITLRHACGFCIPDEEDILRSLLVRLSLEQGYELIVTTGGTGVGPRDITPEATARVLDKRLRGFETAMTVTGLAKTPHAAISRAMAGTIGISLVINMPGSPKAVKESLEAVLPAIGHTLEKLAGDQSDCAVRS